jgi:nucleoside-diphosphate-sugar epimerase
MLLDRLRRRAPISLLEGGSLLTQPVYHRDLGRVCARVLERPGARGGVYNVAGPAYLTTREYYAAVASVLGVEPRVLSFPAELFVRAFPDRAPFAMHRIYSCDRLAEAIGYRPDTPPAHALFEAIDWLQSSGAACPYEESEADRALQALAAAFEAEALAALDAPNAA